MVDRRLVWNQVQAPNLDAASKALARAGESFNSGLGTAQGIIAKYGEGQIERADNELLSDLAKIGSEKEFDAFVDSGGLEGRNISEGLRNTILQTRTGLVSDAGVRARTAGTRAATGIQLAQEGRIAQDYNYGVRQRDELAGLSGALVNARGESRQYGNMTNSENTGSALDNYLASTIQSESGGNPNAKNPKSSATGLGQFTTGTWQQVMAKHPELNLTEDGRTNADQSKRALRAFTEDNMKFLQSAGIPITEGNLYAAHFLGNGGARAVLSQPNNTLVSNILGNAQIEANPFLKGMTVGDFKEFAAKKGGANAPGPSVTGSRESFRNLLANSETLSPTQINSLLGQVNNAQAGGQALIDDAAARATQEGNQLVNEIGAEAINAAINDPTITTQEEMLRAVRKRVKDSLTDSEILDLTGRAGGFANSTEGQGLLSPTVETNPTVNSTQKLLESQLASAANATPQARMIGSIGEYKEDPTGSLVQALGLGTDGESPTSITGLRSEIGFDDNDLKNQINDYARKFGVTPEVAAVAMREAFQRDPFGRNTISNRFPEADVGRIIEESLSQDSINNYREKSEVRNQINIRANRIVNRITELQQAAAKGGDRGQIQQEIASLYTELATLRNNNAIVTPNQ